MVLAAFLFILGWMSSDGDSWITPTVAFVAGGVFLLMAIWGDEEITT